MDAFFTRRGTSRLTAGPGLRSESHFLAGFPSWNPFLRHDQEILKEEVGFIAAEIVTHGGSSFPRHFGLAPPLRGHGGATRSGEPGQTPSLMRSHAPAGCNLPPKNREQNLRLPGVQYS